MMDFFDIADARSQLFTLMYMNIQLLFHALSLRLQNKIIYFVFRLVYHAPAG